MCLTLPKVYKRKIAKKAIKCYKVVVSVDGSFLTPYKDAVVSIGGTYNSKLEVNHFSERDTIRDSIRVGLHSFRTKRAAQREYRYWNPWKSPLIVECEIPIGSIYYSGDFENENDAYASDSLKYVKIIK